MEDTLSINGSAEFGLSPSELAELVGNLGDRPEYAGLFAQLACHPSGRVRMAVASKTALPLDELRKLAHDPCIDVMRRLVFNETVLRVFDREVLLDMVSRDVSIALDLIEGGLHELNPKIQSEVIAALQEHEDPDVQEALAIHVVR